MSTCKYIAAGFIDDAEKLFKDFSKCHNNDFKTFCDVWKKHKFGYIFMGRPDCKELREFTAEIFQLTLNYMKLSSFDSQIAAIYLLYALYRNQDVISPVKIRVSILQYEVFQHAHVYAIKAKVRTLHYIIDYLKKNCFELVANCTLYGPGCSLNKDNPMKLKADQFGILSDLNQEMTILQDSDTILNLKKMRSQYLEQKNSIMSTSGVSRDNGSIVIKDYEKKIQKLKEILGKSGDGSDYAARDSSGHTAENNENSSKSVLEKNDDIGRRRLEIKDAASRMKVMSVKSRCCEEEAVQEPENNRESKHEKVSFKKKRHYNKRVPVNERRVGRPKKYAEKKISSDEYESEDSDLQYSFQILPKSITNVKRGPIGRRKASYLRNYEGPVILTSKQTPIDDCSEISDESFDDELVF